ncbi:urease subunit beta [soil metagenome]
MIPGEVTGPDHPVVVNNNRPTITVMVANQGDRPVQVGSHFHFAETNPALAFDRRAARGFRLDVAAGTSVRFEPGIEREVTLVAFGGTRTLWGFRGEVGGRVDG